MAVCLFLCVALLAWSATAAAVPKRITGALSKPGYTVIALATDSQASSDRAASPGGEFVLKPPAKRVTLQLRGPDGAYAGPVVLRHHKDNPGQHKDNPTVAKGGARAKDRRVIVGVKAGAKLGLVKVRDGYAKVFEPLPSESVDGARIARAKQGVPIGARVVGRVASSLPRAPAAGDSDLDGVPEPLDIDDDGDLILDTVDRATAVRGALPPPPFLSVLPGLGLELGNAANANHPALAAQIETALRDRGTLILGAANPTGGSTELDCAGEPEADPPIPGLVYCSSGGTGRIFSTGEPFPGAPGGPFDSDGDGFGTIPPFQGPPQLTHGATNTEITTGNLLIARLNDAGGTEFDQFTQTLPYVFATVPALVSYSDGTGPAVPVDYPIGPGEPGVAGNGFELGPCPADAPPPCVPGDVVVTLTFWRPQRKPIGTGEEREACLDDAPPCEWVDLGGLGYGAGLGQGECGREFFSESDENLIDPVPRPDGAGAAVAYTDTRLDQPADPSQTLTLSLNITRCLEQQGTAQSFDTPGEERMVHLIAGGGGRADQTFVVERQ